MTISYVIGSSNSSQAGNITLSYEIVGHPVINGSSETQMNITYSGSGHGYSSQNASAIAWFNSSWNITRAEVNGNNFTGAYAVFASFLIEPFTDLFNYQNLLLKNQTIFNEFHNIGTTNENVGGITMPVTTYLANNIHTDNATMESATVEVATLPGTNIQLTAELSATGYTAQGISGTESINFQVTSLTKA
jgi:hypothetical protein